MENKNYVNKIERLNRVSKSGNEYQILRITFTNGYVYETFLTSEQQFILNYIPEVK